MIRTGKKSKLFVESLEVKNFRNYRQAAFSFDPGKNVLYGKNAQGKTNVLEAMQVCSTTKSHRGNHDAEMIRFGKEEAHLRLFFQKHDRRHRIDVHLKKNGKKGAAIDGIPVKRAAELFGTMHLVSFFPEDLRIIKQSPRDRRRFIDSQLCQLDSLYVAHLTEYNKIVQQRNALLKNSHFGENIDNLLDAWDEPMVRCGSYILKKREEFLEELDQIARESHAALTNGSEKLKLIYEPGIRGDTFAKQLMHNREKDRRWKLTTAGPHRDDFQILLNGVDIRHFGSQGQQRSAALSLKLSEIEFVRRSTQDTPVLLLDDVLSELDSERQTMLLKNIRNIQTILTCTGMDELVEQQFPVDRTFYIENGSPRVVETTADLSAPDTKKGDLA